MPPTVQRFGIGLAPDSRTALKRALDKLGEDKLIETGMLIKPEEAGKDSYDRFRGRLMIPIRDPRGRVIAFGGRILGDGEPKYLNSPDTPLFDKGRTLYNIDRAGPASRAAKRLIVVEGYMDVIALDRAGIAEVVAPNGTAVTEAQLERMWRLDPSPILCFDGDSAGRKAAIRAALRALPTSRPERTLRFVELPAGPGPRRRVKLPAATRSRRSACSPAPSRSTPACGATSSKPQPLTTPEARAGLRQRLIDHAATIGDPALARSTATTGSAASTSSAVPPPPARRNRSSAADRSRTAASPRPSRPSASRPAPSPPRHRRADRPRARSLGFANFPEELPAHCEQLAALPIADQQHRAACATSWSTPPSPAPRLIESAVATILGSDGARGGRPRAPWAFPSPAATATRTAPEAIWPQRWRSSPRRRKWKRPWRMQRNG